jgi:hypothetical protein
METIMCKIKLKEARVKPVMGKVRQNKEQGIVYYE